MKTKNWIGMILVLVGTNYFTYSISRDLAIWHVLRRAQERVELVFQHDGLYEKILSNQAHDVLAAITGVEGLHSWWYDSSINWFLGIVLIAYGIGFIFVPNPKKDAQ